MNNDKYIIDIENYLIPIEQIAKKYINIKDIEYCVFTSKLRYPLINKSDYNDFYREPQMAMYCAPMIKNIIKVLLAKNSFYFKYFILDYKNSYFEEFSNSFDDFFKFDLEVIVPEVPGMVNLKIDNFKKSIINNFIKDVYNYILTNIVSFKDFESVIDNINNNLNTFLVNKITFLTNDNFLEMNGVITRLENSLFPQEICHEFIENNTELFKTIYNSFIKKNNEEVYRINDDGIFNIETIIKKFMPDIRNDELELIYNIISKMDDNILKSLPNNVSDYVIEIDDENSYHILTTTEHILEVRLKEYENRN